ncbi:MAG: glycogen/starch/alpha-glucan phosphorylase [Clostridia bacterium]|nr:glycogen/starch/alpha-glucan phosphorylase [Clostridia bacterium]
MSICDCIEKHINKQIEDCSNEEIYYALLKVVLDYSQSLKVNRKGKKLYYISAEFLIGKLLSNNLINLGIYDEVKKLLEKHGKNLSDIEEIEPEPSLGNGGLGRLAACFLDSIATLGLNGDGIGLNYHFGLFNQKFIDNQQVELPDKWIEDKSWLIATDRKYTVQFANTSVEAKMYDIDVIGYNNNVNKLHLFDLATINEELIGEGISFDKTNIENNLTLFLYPDDSDEKGKLLRLYQQYFMVSSAAQFIIDECIEKGGNLEQLNEYVVIQINDTHPTLIIPELVRLLVERGISYNNAIEIVKKTCAYTNHTILAEALEKWPIDYVEKVAPQLVPIIEILDNKIRRVYNKAELNIIDEFNYVHMARIDIHYGFSINGVASLHTDILKENELNAFYKIYPEKFSNKTNGITFRRWLLKANPLLCEYITGLIGDGYKRDASELEKLLEYVDNDDVLESLIELKHQNKLRLKQYLKKTQNIVINENSIFDIQIKRLHEYKRQQMNILYLIVKYLEIHNGILPPTPITAIFGAKAAPAYQIAQDIIHLILCLSKVIQEDAIVKKHLNVVMVENYNVSKAEVLIPACDISEQISLASKEASGTGNMKLMLNGAVTLGTRDGANVEIENLVGDENIYIFGKSSDDVILRYKTGDYRARDYYENDKDIRAAIDFITSDKMLNVGNKESLERIKNEIISKDWFMTLLDLKAYTLAKDKAILDYKDKTTWARKMFINIANAGYFSSDRTIKEYNRDIWKLN